MSDYLTYMQGIARAFPGVECWVCDLTDDPRWHARCIDVSGHERDGHHLVPKQTIKRELRRVYSPDELREVLWDPRNGIPVRRYCHDLLERCMFRIPRLRLPASVEEFAGDVGLDWYLDRTYGFRAEVA